MCTLPMPALVKFIVAFFANTLIFQESWKTNTDYVKVNLYLRMLHPLTTTGLVPMLLLLILNIRITTGIKQLQVGYNFDILYYAHLKLG